MSGPLDGVRVLDLGQYLAGPYGPMILGDLGAEVIKIEPVHGDAMRSGAPFLGCQRGKLDVALDLKHPEGLEIVYQLVKGVDVVHHNMTKGTADRLGVGYDQLIVHNPELIYCNTYAYGKEGPLSVSGGLDPLYQASTGLEYEAGAVSSGNPPMWIRYGMTDTANAFSSVLAVLLALFNRDRTGRGQDVWTSLLNGAAMFVSETSLLPDGTAARNRPSMDKAMTGLSPCYRLYPTQDGWIQVAASSPEQWAALCSVIGLPDLGSDPSLASFDLRASARDRVEPTMEEAFGTRTALVWQALLDAAGVPAEISVDTQGGRTVLHDVDNQRLGLAVTYDHPRVGAMSQFGSLVDFSRTPKTDFAPPPAYGQHTRAVLGSFGYSEDQIDGFIERRVVAQYSPAMEYPWSV